MLTLPQTAIVVFLLTGVSAYSGLREELQEAREVWSKAIIQQDAEKAALTYTEDCTMTFIGRDAVHGRKDVKKLLRSLFDHGMAKLTFVTEEVGPSDATDTAYDRSSWTMFDKEDNIMGKGKHILIWKKVNGVWLAHNFIANFGSEVPTQLDDDTLKAELEALTKAYAAAFKDRNYAALASFYTEDAREMHPGLPTTIGKEAILKGIEQGKEIAEVHAQSEEVGYLGLSKDMAYNRGYFRLMQKDGKIVAEGKHTMLLKRVEGQWKSYVGIWSPATPPEKPHEEL